MGVKKMEGMSFKPGLRFRWNNNEYLIRKFFDDENVEVSNLSYSNQIEVFSMHELLSAWSDDHLIVNVEQASKFSAVKVHDVSLLSAEEKELMERRYLILKPIISGEIKPEAYDNYIKHLSVEDKKIIGSKATLYRWLKRWKDTEDKRSLMINTNIKKRVYNTHPIVVNIIEDLLKKEESTGLKTTIRDKWIEMKMKINEYNETREALGAKIKPCSTTTVFRIVQDKTDTYEIDKARHGRVQADLNKSGSTTEVEVERPLERIEIDSTPLDILIVDFQTQKPKRFHLIYAIDSFSGYPLGFYISPHEPNIHAIKQCVLHCMLPKVNLEKLYPTIKHEWTAYGVPENIVVDNAKVNESKELEEIFGLVGTTIQYCPVKTGHHKGRIERALQTINKKIHKIPGTTFSNTQEKSQYDSEGEAVVTLKTLYEVLHHIFIELIANDFSQAVGGTPAFVWREGLKAPNVHRTLPYKKDDLILLLSTGIDFRKISNKGIEIQSQYYQSQELKKLYDIKARKLDDESVRIRFDMADMREIYVYDEYENRYIKALPTKNSLSKKKMDDRYPIHYEQLHAYSYNIEHQYRIFDTTDIAEANRTIVRLVHESKARLKEIQKLSDDERALEFARDMAEIQAIFDAQLAPKNIDSIELLEDIGVNTKEKQITATNQNKKESGSKKVGNNKERKYTNKVILSVTTENDSTGENLEQLEGFEISVRKKV